MLKMELISLNGKVFLIYISLSNRRESLMPGIKTFRSQLAFVLGRCVFDGSP